MHARRSSYVSCFYFPHIRALHERILFSVYRLADLKALSTFIIISPAWTIGTMSKATPHPIITASNDAITAIKKHAPHSTTRASCSMRKRLCDFHKGLLNRRSRHLLDSISCFKYFMHFSQDYGLTATAVRIVF